MSVSRGSRSPEHLDTLSLRQMGRAAWLRNLNGLEGAADGVSDGNDNSFRREREDTFVICAHINIERSEQVSPKNKTLT